MTQYIKATIVCDVHDAKGQDVPGSSYTIQVDGRPKAIDLCDPCWTKYVKPLHTVVSKYGQNVALKAKASADKAESCLWCPKSYTVIGTLLDHLETAHGLEHSTKVFGNRCPLDGEEFAGLGHHTARAHDMTLTQAFIKARAEGDPHGVVRQVLALVEPDPIYTPAGGVQSR